MKIFRHILVSAFALGLALWNPSVLFSQKTEPRIVASTSWTAAFALAAGAENIGILAPLELKHPPEYELKPSDLAMVGAADLVIYAGYERFAKKLAETAGARTLRVTTVNDPQTIRSEVRKIAEKIMTQDRYEKWEKEFGSLTEEIKKKVLAAYPDKRAVVHTMQKPFAQWLGFEIVGEFGPAEPSPALVLELVRKRPLLVIDNYHNPCGFPIAEAAKSRYTALINFPGKDGSRSIEDVYRLNAEALIGAKRN
jgi:hypothetical protein